MDREKFRKYYLMSMLFTILATIVIFVSVISILFSTGSAIATQITGKEIDQNLSVISQFVWNVLFQSIYCIIGFALYIGGAIWNIVISYIRSSVQSKHTLIIVVVLGWMALFVFPVIGFLISMILQIWAWFLGSKD